MHRFAHEVLAQHRADRGATVAATRERGATRTLQADVEPPPPRIDDFAEQHCPSVSEAWIERTELVPGVRLSDRVRTWQQLVAREVLSGFGSKSTVVEPQRLSEFVVERDQPRLLGRGWNHFCKQPAELAGVRVVERDQETANQVDVIRAR